MWPKVPRLRRFIRPIGNISPPLFFSLGNNQYYVSYQATPDYYLSHNRYSRLGLLLRHYFKLQRKFNLAANNNLTYKNYRNARCSDIVKMENL